MTVTGVMSSRESWVTGQLTDQSRGSRVIKYDPLSAVMVMLMVVYDGDDDAADGGV